MQTVLSLISGNSRQILFYAAFAGGALLLGAFIALVPFFAPLDVEQANTQWDVAQLDDFDSASLSGALSADGQWVIDPRTIRQRERQALERQQQQQVQADSPTDWTFLGLVGEGETRYAVILVEGSNTLLYGLPGEDLPSGETILQLTETSMSVQSLDGEKEYRLFVRN